VVPRGKLPSAAREQPSVRSVSSARESLYSPRVPSPLNSKPASPEGPLAAFHAPVRRWFEGSFAGPTPAQLSGWPPIQAGLSTLLFAPTGSGKTLAAFLVAIDRLMFSPEPARRERCRLLYVSPLKALAADVERNLRAPLAGIAAVAARDEVPFRLPTVAIRSGDTSPAQRAGLARTPPDILITTPESLYLLLTSKARAILSSVEAVIVDEIHSLVATKRGAHLFLSLERLEALRPRGAPALVRIGLSATARPLTEVARLLGGGEIGAGGEGAFCPRPVEIVDAGAAKRWDLRVEVPVLDMARLDLTDAPAPGAAKGSGASELPRRSIWPSMYPRLVELIRAHRSTMIFANSRRIAERFAAAINEAAGEELALAHHGSVARERRFEIEERLKKGELPAIVATSSLELGLDIGAVDLVIQIEAPPSVASGLQRIGRAGHAVGAVSRGVIFPKYRGDLLSSAAATASMLEGRVEATLYPRNPLDVLAQQIVAIAAMEEVDEGALFELVRRAAPFADLPRGSFEGVLDMLSGRYPSDEFAELRPRITWDRTLGKVRAREGAKRIAVVNGGTIPDRGLYGVYLVDSEGGRGSRRVGELDEEMVFESRAGDVFLLGASSWRIDEITHDRVLVRPAPGVPGKMPFWHGDRPGRPLEFGRAIGALARSLAASPPAEARARLRKEHGLDERAADNLVAYLGDQVKATGEVPSDQRILIERYRDEIGDYRVCVLSPFGARVHAPWCTAVLGAFRAERDQDIEGMWSDDGIVFRLPGADEPPSIDAFLPLPDQIEDSVVQSLGQSSVFAARFRENAGRALLLPRRRPGQRSPLWATRKKAADLLRVASRYGSFPLILETYRECLRDVFDLPGLVEILGQIAAGEIAVQTVDSRAPSPFAASLLFSYVANFIYEGDAPLAERRAQALSVDPVKLKELLGEAELRELLDAEAITALARSLQRLDGLRPLTHPDGLHDLLLSIGDLTAAEIRARAAADADVDRWITELLGALRIIEISVAGERRYAAAEDAARLRDALGVPLPRGLPLALLEPALSLDPLGDLISRFARTHGPFRLEEAAARFGLGVAPVRSALLRLAEQGRVIEGEFTPRTRGIEWCDAEILRGLKRRSLAKLRKAVEPVPAEVLGRFLVEWHGLHRPRAGADALLAAIERLSGAPISAKVLEEDVLPARIARYRRGDLDLLCAAGEVTWMGIEPLGASDGRIELFLTAQLPLLAPPPRPATSELAGRLRALFERRGALFFSDLVAETSVFPGDLLAALWELVWASEVTNDTLAPLRSLAAGAASARPTRRSALHDRALRGRRMGPPGSEGRWSLFLRRERPPSETERRAALAQVLLDRHGVLTREAVQAEGIAGGFSAVYDVLKAMEEAGRVRRGYFVAGLGATQFALPGADDRLRALRERPEAERVLVLAATDPANPYGAALPWPEAAAEANPGARPQRGAGAQVILSGGRLLGYLSRSEKDLLTFLPAEEPERSRAALELASALAALVEEERRRTLLIGQIDGGDPAASPLSAPLVRAGFTPTSKGYFKRGGALRAGRDRGAGARI
jgi:ATP-dependent Lhr-like helicase